MTGVTRSAALPLVALACIGCAHGLHQRSFRHAAYARTDSADPLVRKRVVIGRSVLGRPITAVELGDPDERRSSLVVGVIHGDEPAGRAVVRRLERGPLPRAATLWIIEELNPDGLARHTRQNAHRVDLNRNFPRRWQPLGRPGDQQYSGPRPLSEPESRAASRLILALRPRITVWFHQPLAVTDISGGDARIERRFAALSGLPPRRLTRYPGSAASWENHRLPGSTAFVVELPRGRPPASALERYARAVRQVAA
ncbi:M14 family zinc carboxypeptidase [Candidatus Solirubrobacter pratensis]|uniref:M14 family zinc carboxypeptidase n=1 Tax=Candidatus Solirubrobacter pratensis TaxID=1298857 RepID=UPI0009DBE74D|nr:M14 family zinc carboxypeptidase [Candidatus Solirubrobacter pratensis]